MVAFGMAALLTLRRREQMLHGGGRKLQTIESEMLANRGY
jgi:hypothetical protein